MSSIIWSVGGLIVALGLLVTVHEFGHFIVARAAGVRVLRFSVGFGKPIFRWQRDADSTEYVLAMIPLGGYVKMLGEAEQEVDPGLRAQAFSHKSLGQRVAIVSAGPIANFLLAIVLFWALYLIGITGFKPIVGELQSDSFAAQVGFVAGDQIVAIGEDQVILWEEVGLKLLASAVEAEPVAVEVVTEQGQRQVRWIDFAELPNALEQADLLTRIGMKPQLPALPAVIGELVPGEPAQRAGLLPGDKLLNADGDDISGWGGWVDYVRARPETEITLELERDGMLVTLVLTPSRREQGGEVYGRIGALPDVPENWYDGYRATRRYGLVAALGKGIEQTGDMSLLTLKMLGKMVVGEVSLKNINGPISIAEYAGRSAKVGLSAFLKLVAFLSISIGILNLLPIPVLDGGHLLYYFAEWVRGKPLSEAMRGLGQQGGLVFLLGLTVLALYNDVQRLMQ
ncbi:MAG: RIP metalloprotease RseP [Immundisolibacteraceae bacterium]|nr:RIP metalloprotease RseP [Immundisolibacteraceae bacterium]